MNWTVAFAMFGWIPLVAIAFMAMTPPRAVLLCYLAGWMFLPIATFQVTGLPDYSKEVAVPAVVFLAIVVFDGRRLQAFRPRLVDLPMAIYCLSPAISSLSNDLGWYDAVTAMVSETMVWGLPYLTGRLYFSSAEGREQLALGVLLGCMIYAPLCLWEVRMSPQLHAILYGYHQHDWHTVLRGGGYRPMVFMNHGLMVGLWMAAGSLVGLACWMSDAAKRVWGVPLWLVVPGLFAVTVLCKSFGALALLLAGALVLLGMRSLRTSLAMALLVCLPFLWVGARASGNLSSDELTPLVGSIAAERADSLAFRMDSEDILLKKALLKPLFGWGGWDRSNPVAVTDRTIRVTTDSLWIIVLGKFGFLGLSSLMLALAVPVFALWRRSPPRLWAIHRGAAVAWALALVLTLFAIDCLVNAMYNPIYLMIGGALAGGFALQPAVRAIARARPRIVRVTLPTRPAGRTIPPRASAR